MEDLIKKCSDSQLDEIIKMVNAEKDHRMQNKIKEFRELFKNLIKEAWTNGVCIKLENDVLNDPIYLWHVDELIFCRANDDEIDDYHQFT